MISPSNVVMVEYIALPKKLQDYVKTRPGFCNDSAQIYDEELPSYNYLCNYDSELAKIAKENNCSEKEWESEFDDKFIKALFDLNPVAFEDYEAVVVNICW